MKGNNLAKLMNHPQNTASNATSDSSDFPLAFNSLWAFAVSFPTLWNWIRLFLIGGLLESARRSVGSVQRHLVRQFVFTITFDQKDVSYQWIVCWLSNQPAWDKTRRIDITTKPEGRDGISDNIPGEDPQVEALKDRKKSYIQLLPALNEPLYVRFKHTWIRAGRQSEEKREVNGATSTTDKLTLSIFAWNRAILYELLIEAKRLHKAENEGRVKICVPRRLHWFPLSSRRKRSLSFIVMDKGVKERIVADAKEFMASENWYAERGIPWRRGYLLYGAPGCGKTSLIHALAGELGLDIYILSLSQYGLDDSDLRTLVSSLPSKSIVLIEDIDAAFLHSINREASSEPNATADSRASGGKNHNQGFVVSAKESKSSAGSGGVTLSGLLNAIDGVAAQEGRILFATTNKYQALDSALVRPGRLDVHIEFKLAERAHTEELFRCFYHSMMNQRSKATSEVEPLIQLADEKNLDATTDTPSKSPQFDITSLSKSFASRIPEGEFSMAEIQGHLMRYKTNPQAAIDTAEKWVEDERRQRKERGT